MTVYYLPKEETEKEAKRLRNQLRKKLIAEFTIEDVIGTDQIKVTVKEE